MSTIIKRGSVARPASGIFEIQLPSGEWLATDDLDLFHSWAGPRLVNGQRYSGPVRPTMQEEAA